MGIISTFDPKFQKRAIQNNIELYGAENIVHITKSKLFLWLKILIPSIFLTALLVVLLTLVIVYIDITWIIISLTILFVFSWLGPMSKILKYYLDYKMDFIVVNPKSLIRYNQEGFFKRISKTIDLKDVRSTSVRKNGILSSIFNNGDLVFLSEAGEKEDDEAMRAGEVVFRYVSNPDKVDRAVNKLLSGI